MKRCVLGAEDINCRSFHIKSTVFLFSRALPQVKSEVHGDQVKPRCNCLPGLVPRPGSMMVNIHDAYLHTLQTKYFKLKPQNQRKVLTTQRSITLILLLGVGWCVLSHNRLSANDKSRGYMIFNMGKSSDSHVKYKVLHRIINPFSGNLNRNKYTNLNYSLFTATTDCDRLFRAEHWDASNNPGAARQDYCHD